MSYWSHNPELLDKITIKFLPDQYRTPIEQDAMDLGEVPDFVRLDAMEKAIEDYWGSMTDEVMMRAEDEAVSDIGKGSETFWEKRNKPDSDFVPI
jgi:hypothetical protein